MSGPARAPGDPRVLYRLEGVGRRFAHGAAREVKALDDVNLVLPPGGLTVLEGPSGSGKTTLLGLLAGLDRPTDGRLLLVDTDLATLPEPRLAALRRSTFGFLFQSPNLLPRLSAWANVTVPLLPTGLPAPERRRRGEELLELVGLAAFADATPEELSGGELQRVAFARALVNSPRVLLLDEPTSALDEATADQLLELLARMLREDITVVVASHDRRLMEMASSRVSLSAGRVASVRSAGGGEPR